MDHKHILAVMIEAAKKGGNQALAKQGFTPVVSDTGGGNLTTQQDYDSQASIIKILEEKLPGINILAEEKVAKKITGTDLIIDPIDGSVNFARGGSDWSSTIAYTENNKVVIGVIWQPRTRRLATGIRQTCLNLYEGEQAIDSKKPTSPFQLSSSVIQFPVSGGDFSDEVFDQVINPLAKSVRFTRNIFCNTGSILELMMGLTDAFIGCGAIWDFAAGIFFSEMAGGVATDYWGKPIDMTQIKPQRVILARSQEILDALLPFTSKWPTAQELRQK